jgi:hypothetical protein
VIFALYLEYISRIILVLVPAGGWHEIEMYAHKEFELVLDSSRTPHCSGKFVCTRKLAGLCATNRNAQTQVGKGSPPPAEF